MRSLQTPGEDNHQQVLQGAKMDKAYVDETIAKYLKKIYGFALSKTMSIDMAEELASRITFEVYKSLLKAEDIYNIDGYVYRIASNIYSRFLIEEKNKRKLEDINPSINNLSFVENIDDTHARLRTEIAYLNKMQRDIVVMYYYQKLKLKEIATALNIPIGTVGWHLTEARDQIKNGLTEFSNIDNKAPKPIFKDLKILGFTGIGLIIAPFYFKLKISQQIAYSAYHKPKTSIEIAKELSIPSAFVENELKFLVDNQFMNALPGNRFLTNIYIIEPNKEKEQKINDLLTKYAEIVCKEYVPLIVKNYSNDEMKDSIYYPNNDINFLLWSIISYACSKKLNIIDKKNYIPIEKFMIERKDGGVNIALTTLDIAKRSDSKGVKLANYNSNNKYASLGYMHSGLYILKRNEQQKTWLFNSHFDDRPDKYSDYDISIIKIIQEFMDGKIPKIPENIDKYMKLINSGLLVSNKDKDLVNLVIVKMSTQQFEQQLPEIPHSLLNIAKNLDKEMFDINKNYFPKHMKDLCYVLNQNTMSSGQMRLFIFNNLLKNNVLKPIKKHQRKTVNMIMFKGELP